MSEPTSTFIKVRCTKCKNEQVIFGKAAAGVSCHMCQEPLATSTGGKSKVTGQVLEVLE